MPKGGASSLTPVYAGLREDLDSFLKSYLRMESIRFADYKRLFEHRGMIRIFNGRSNNAEIIEFNESLLIHCLPYMEQYVSEGISRSLKERLFGLYSLYTFFYVQQDNHVVKIRMDPDAARNFTKLTELLLREKIYDAYMACLKLLEDKAIKHVAFIASHDPANFKRFYTDEKVLRVSIRVNQNDPLGNVRALIDSELFAKLGIMHRVYTSKKENARFVGNQLEDVQKKMRGIIGQYEKEIEVLPGVEEIINTDHSPEQLASRGMLRTSIKEQAHSADLKLARYRRHRSSTPLLIQTDTFDYIDEFVAETKNVKRIKPEAVDPELSDEPPLKRRTRQGRKNHNPSAPTTLPDESVTGMKFKTPLKKPEPLDTHATESIMGSAPESSINTTEFEERSGTLDEPMQIRTVKKQFAEEEEIKPEDDRLGELAVTLEQMSQHLIQTSEHQQPTLAISMDQLYFDDLESISTDCSQPNMTPKSIIKTEKKLLNRRVSFRIKEDSEEVATTIYEIPCRECIEEDSSSKHEKETRTHKTMNDEKPFSDIPELAPAKTMEEVHDDTHFDDADMFRTSDYETTEEAFDASGSDSDTEMEIDEDAM